MLRTATLVLSGGLTALLASCSAGEPSSPGGTADFSDPSSAVAAQVSTASMGCTVSETAQGFTVTVTWSKVPVESVALLHSFDPSRTYTQVLNHPTQKGTFTVVLDFEPVFAVFYDRTEVELAQQSCSGV
jgi:hypothetical protein